MGQGNVKWDNVTLGGTMYEQDGVNSSEAERAKKNKDSYFHNDKGMLYVQRNAK